MKSSIRISKNGNRIHAKGAAALALFDPLTSSPEPKGTRFYSQARKQEMVLVMDETSEWNGWIFYKHVDGRNWVSLRKATEADKSELAQAMVAAHHAK